MFRFRHKPKVQRRFADGHGNVLVDHGRLTATTARRRGWLRPKRKATSDMTPGLAAWQQFLGKRCKAPLCIESRILN